MVYKKARSSIHMEAVCERSSSWQLLLQCGPWRRIQLELHLARRIHKPLAGWTPREVRKIMLLKPERKKGRINNTVTTRFNINTIPKVFLWDHVRFMKPKLTNWCQQTAQNYEHLEVNILLILITKVCPLMMYSSGKTGANQQWNCKNASVDGYALKLCS